MPLINVFENDWRECLKAHYQHVVEEQDFGNERSLITVLHDSGFDDDEIQAMRRDILGLSETISEEDNVQAEVTVEVAPTQTEYAEAVEITDSAESIAAPTLLVDTVEINEADVTADIQVATPTNNETQPKPTARKKPKQLSMF